jgi:hypothetical protein
MDQGAAVPRDTGSNLIEFLLLTGHTTAVTLFQTCTDTASPQRF